MSAFETITRKIFKSLRVADETSETTQVKSLDFHYNGEHLIYNTETFIKFLHLTERRVQKYKTYLYKYGVGLSKFYGPTLILHTSLKENNDLRLLEVQQRDNPGYVRYFPGHARKVVSVDVTSKLIASGSEDTTVRLWDPRKQEHIKIMKFPSTPLVAFHPNSFWENTNHLFAVAYNSSIIEIFTANNTEKSENKFEFERINGVEWTSLKFSPDGSKLIVTTNSSLIKIIESSTGQEISDLKGKTLFLF